MQRRASLLPEPQAPMDSSHARPLMAVFSAIALASPAFAIAADVTIDVRRERDIVTIDATATVDADAAVAWRVLTDYPRYPEFIPGLRSSRVLRRPDGQVEVTQDGTASVGPLRLAYEARYDVRESPPDAIRSSGTIAGVGTLDSTYVLAPAGARTRIRYAGSLRAESAFLRPLVHAAGADAISRQFRALADEIERGAVAQKGHQPSGTGTPRRRAASAKSASVRSLSGMPPRRYACSRPASISPGT